MISSISIEEQVNISNRTKTPLEGFLLRYQKGVAPSISAVNQTITQSDFLLAIEFLFCI